MSSEDDEDPLSIYAELAKDLKEMVNNAELGDIVFVCEDGVQVHSCRMLLAARSSFFRQMLLNGMAESRESTVKLPAVTSSVLIVVLKFLFVGKLSEEDLYPSMLPIKGSGGVERSSVDKSGFPRLDWNLLVKVVVASRFFMLDRLGRVIIDRLRTDLPGGSGHSEDSINRIASRLSIVCGYPEVWTGEGEVKSIEAICSSIVYTLMIRDLSSATLLHLSEEAFRYYLTESRRISGDGHCEWSLGEYLRLRQILTWCAIRDNGLGGLGNFDRTCLPGPEIAIRFLEAKGETKKDSPVLEFDFSPGRTYLVNTIAKESLKPLLDMVHLASIHPELLCSVIQPLNIIEPLELSKVLGVQAVRGSRLSRKSVNYRISSVWDLLFCSNELYRVQDNDYFTLTLSTQSGMSTFNVTAIAGLQMHRCKKYEWEIVAIPHGSVGQCTMGGFEFGFFRLGNRDLETFDWDPSVWLSRDPRGSALKINEDLRSAVFHHKESVYNWNLASGKQFEWRTPLKVLMSKVNNTCTFSYAGDEITVSVDRLEHEPLFPAIDFVVEHLDKIPFTPHYDQLTVRIQNLEGFRQMVAHDNLQNYVL